MHPYYVELTQTLINTEREYESVLWFSEAVVTFFYLLRSSLLNFESKQHSSLIILRSSLLNFESKQHSSLMNSIAMCSGYLQLREDFWFNRNIAGRGAPPQSWPICLNKRRAFWRHFSCTILVTQSSLVATGTRYWNLFKVRLKLRTQGFLSSKILRESSLRTCIGQLGTLLFETIQSTFVYISYVRLEPNQLSTLLSS